MLNEYPYNTVLPDHNCIDSIEITLLIKLMCGTCCNQREPSDFDGTSDLECRNDSMLLSIQKSSIRTRTQNMHTITKQKPQTLLLIRSLLLAMKPTIPSYRSVSHSRYRSISKRNQYMQTSRERQAMKFHPSKRPIQKFG